MNTQTTVVIMTVIIGFAGLILWASTGAIMAVIVLAVVAALALILAGAMVTVYVVKVMNDRARQQFYDNVHEDIAALQGLQKLMNSQGTYLMKQLISSNKQLPASTTPQNGYDDMFDWNDFDELD